MATATSDGSMLHPSHRGHHDNAPRAHAAMMATLALICLFVFISDLHMRPSKPNLLRSSNDNISAVDTDDSGPCIYFQFFFILSIINIAAGNCQQIEVCWVCLSHIQIISTMLAEPKNGLAILCIQWHVHLGMHLDHSIYLRSSFAQNVDILLVCAAAWH